MYLEAVIAGFRSQLEILKKRDTQVRYHLYPIGLGLSTGRFLFLSFFLAVSIFFPSFLKLILCVFHIMHLPFISLILHIHPLSLQPPPKI